MKEFSPLSQELIYVTWFVFLVVMVRVGVTFHSWISGLASTAGRNIGQNVSECSERKERR